MGCIFASRVSPCHGGAIPEEEGMTMATKTKNASRKTSSRSRSSNGARSSAKSTSRKTSAKRSSSATAKRSSNGGAKRTRSGSKTTAKSSGNGAVTTAKQVVSKAKGPAVAVGAAAAGLAGGLALKGRSRRKTVLGVPLPRSLKPDLDVKSLAKNVGQASQRVAKTSKSVSKDIERAGDKAERIGKILG